MKQTYERYPASSFARVVALAISLPDDVDINEVLFRPTSRLFAPNRRGTTMKGNLMKTHFYSRRHRGHVVMSALAQSSITPNASTPAIIGAPRTFRVTRW